MHVTVLAVGRIPARAPERLLADDYCDRFRKLGRSIGLRGISEVEIDQRKAQGMAAEADALRKALPQGALLWALDERGQQLSSRDFATQFQSARSAGHADLALMIGGADGLQPDLKAQANQLISFGAMVWPHMLIRAMLYEQLYRAATILTGGPYHRD